MSTQKFVWEALPEEIIPKQEKEHHHQFRLTKKHYLYLIIIFFMGAIFASLIYYFQSTEEENDIFSLSSPSNAPVGVIISARDLHRGEEFKEKDFTVIMTKTITKIPGILTIKDASKFLGKILAVDIEKNIPLIASVFQTDFQGKGAPGRIPPGKRLFVLDVDPGAISTLLRPGDSVDVIAMLDLPGVGKAAETILEGVTLVGRDENSSKRHPEGALSFYLTPAEVKLLSFMRQYARFSVVLRNPADATPGGGTPVTLDRFLNSPLIRKIREGQTSLRKPSSPGAWEYPMGGS